MPQHKLLQREFSLGKFLNSIQIGILFIDENYQIQSPNHKCTDIFGLSKNELEQVLFLNLLENESRELFSLRFKALQNSEEYADSKVFELKVWNEKTQNKLTVELNINSTLTQSDNLYILIINDISDKKYLEKEIEDQIDDNEEVRERLQKAEELNELKSRFVTMASHEFRTPLAGVLSSLNLVQRYIDAEEDNGTELIHRPKINNHFNKIRESVGNLTQILNEFLSLGKLEAGKVTCHWELVDLRSLITSLPEDFQRLTEDNQKIWISLEINQDCFLLDSGMVRNILNNLISNAIKYSKANSKITVKLVELEEELHLQVKDEGIGISKEEKVYIFERFFRAKNATNIQGTGLGLNIVKRYVEMMGGSITFDSELNKGTTFNVLLPIRNEVKGISD